VIYVGIYYAIGLLMELAIERDGFSTAGMVVAAIWPVPIIMSIAAKIRWEIRISKMHDAFRSEESASRAAQSKDGRNLEG